MHNFFSRIVVSGTVLVAIFFMMSCQPMEAQPLTMNQDTMENESAAKGQLIIKVTPEVGQKIDEVLQQAPTAVTIGLDWFDELSERFAVSRVDPLLKKKIKYDSIKEKYPGRSARSPQEGKVPEVNYIYTLTLGPNIDVQSAVTFYEARPEVIYAQLNIIMETQQQ